MIHGLAEIALRIWERLAAFPHQKRQEARALGLEQICGTIEQLSPRLPAEAVPIIRGRLCRIKRPVDRFRTGTPADAGDDAPVVRRRDAGDFAAAGALLPR